MGVQEKDVETLVCDWICYMEKIGMNVNKYAWVSKMQMQRKGAYHHTMIRTEVQMVCEH